MRIHTTQNLSSLSTNQPNSVSLSKNDRFKRAQNSYLSSNLSIDLQNSISFKGKGDAADKFFEAVRKEQDIYTKYRKENRRSLNEKERYKEYFAEKKIQDITDKHCKEVDVVADTKQKEIMEI